MLSKLHVFKILLFTLLLVQSALCFGDLKEIRKEPFKARIGNYSKYLKAPSIKSSKILKPARSNIISNKPTVNNKKYQRLKRSSLGAIQSLGLDYFRNLHETFLQNVQIFRFWIQFLKLRPDLGLKEFKIRTQQLRNTILQGTEASIQTRQQLIKISNFIKDLEHEVQNNSIQFIETPLYSKLVTSQARINFLIDSVGFYVDHLATLQTFQLKNLVEELDFVIEQIELINAEYWNKSFDSILLKEQPTLITKIKKLTRQKLNDFKQIKQNYIYAESQILVKRDEIKPKKLPASRDATREEEINFSNLQKNFIEKITEFTERESIQLQILKHKITQAKKWLTDYPTIGSQPLIPLANQLFKSNQNIQPNKHFNNFLKKPKTVSIERRSRTSSTIRSNRIDLPDWI